MVHFGIDAAGQRPYARHSHINIENSLPEQTLRLQIPPRRPVVSHALSELAQAVLVDTFRATSALKSHTVLQSRAFKPICTCRVFQPRSPRFIIAHLACHLSCEILECSDDDVNAGLHSSHKMRHSIHRTSENCSPASNLPKACMICIAEHRTDVISCCPGLRNKAVLLQHHDCR